MATPSRRRAGLQPVLNLPEEFRRVLEPLTDRVARVTGDVQALRKLTRLASDASLLEVIQKLNEVIDRLQED